MNGNAQKLIKYMDGASKRFIIPVYQRNYDWKMEHCKAICSVGLFVTCPPMH